MGDKSTSGRSANCSPWPIVTVRTLPSPFYQTIAETDGARVTAAVLRGAVDILPADHFDAFEAASQIRAYLTDTTVKAAQPLPDPLQAFTAATSRLLQSLHRVADPGTLRAVARENPGVVRQALADIRAVLDEIEQGTAV